MGTSILPSPVEDMRDDYNEATFTIKMNYGEFCLVRSLLHDAEEQRPDNVDAMTLYHALHAVYEANVEPNPYQ